MKAIELAPSPVRAGMFEAEPKVPEALLIVRTS